MLPGTILHTLLLQSKRINKPTPCYLLCYDCYNMKNREMQLLCFSVAYNDITHTAQGLSCSIPLWKVETAVQWRL